MKKIFFIFIVISNVFCYMLFPESGSYTNEGIDPIVFNLKTHPFPPRYPYEEFKFNYENLRKFADFDKWIQEVGLNINVISGQDIFRNVKKAFNQIWKDAIYDLRNCPEFSNFKTKEGNKLIDVFNERLKKGEYKFAFTDNRDVLGDNIGGVDQQDRMFIKSGYIEDLVKYCANKYKNNQSNFEDYKSDNKLYELYSFVGHEMIHLFANYAKESDDKTSAHCEVYCFQKTCLKLPVGIPVYCNDRCYKGYCQDGNFKPCKPTPPGGGARRSDNADDNYSYASANSDALSSGGLDFVLGLSGSPGEIPGEFFCSYFPDIMIYNKFEPEAMKNLLNRSEAENFVDDYEHTDFSNNHKVLVVPSGELMGEKDSELIKQAFKRFVATGGVLLVLGQQDGGDFDNLVPIPDGQNLRSYGWRSDQSCFNGSLYFKGMHPALSGLVNERVSAGVDGYFSAYPDNATILLRRFTNQEPALFYYPYGQGTVILTSMFTDWGAEHGQASWEELRLIRDLVTFAKNPNLDIPMFDLSVNANPLITLNVKIKNGADASAAKAKIKVSTPDRSRVLYEIEQNITLISGADGEISIAFNLPDFTSKDYGICHTDYELYDAEGNVIQLFSESDGGRFAVYLVQTKYNPGQGLFTSLTVEREELYPSQNLEFDVHFRNFSDQTKTIDVPKPFLSVSHGNGVSDLSPIYLEIPPGEERIHHVSIPMTKISNSHDATIGIRFQYYDEQNVLRQFGQAKVLFMKKWATTSLLAFSDAVPGTLSIQLPFKSATAINYSITVQSDIGAVSGLTKIRLVADHYVGMELEEGWSYHRPHYHEVETVYETEYDFASGNPFQYSGQFTPTQEYYTIGGYRLRLTVVTSDKSVEEEIKYFYYVKSNVSLALDTIPEAFKIKDIFNLYGLIPGQTYSVNFKLKNSGNFKVKHGRYIVTLKSALGTEVFRKEATGIALNESQELTFSEPFVFSPVEVGEYLLQVEYSDETRTAELVTKFPTMEYRYLFDLQMSRDWAIHHYMDTVNIQLKIAAVGPIHIKFTDVITGAVQERNIVIPVEQNNTTEIFQVPVSIFSTSSLNLHKLSALVTDSFGKSLKVDTVFFFSALIFAHTARTNAVGIEEGKPLNLTLAFTEKSGVSVPFPAVLDIQSTSLNFSDSKTVTIQPSVANEFNYQIPIAATVADGFHEITYRLKVDGREITQGSTSITMPLTALSFSEPPAAVNAGAAFDLQFENSGGRQGTFAVRILVNDENKKQALEHEETLTMMPGEKKTVTLNMPEGLKSGRYILAQEGKHDISGQVFNLNSGIQISGIEATLNAYTLKDKYFDNETVAGKAEITNGAHAIVNSKLRAKIVKSNRNGGIKVFRPSGENEVRYGQSLANKTYFVTNYGLVEYDRSTSKYIEVLDRQDLDVIYITADGEIWLATRGNGVLHRNLAGVWTNYSIASGLLSNDVWDFIENDQGGIWMATEAGISVLNNGAWSSYTTANGLSSDNVFEFAKDADGKIWAWSEGGIDRFNGSTFTKVDTPFNPANVSEMKSNAIGDIWLTYHFYDPNLSVYQLWRYTQGNWNHWDMSAIYPGLNLWDIGEDDGTMWFTGFHDGPGGCLIVKFDGMFTVYDSAVIPEIWSVGNIIPVPGWDGLYFGSNPGFVEFSSGQCQQRLIEIDDNKLLGPVNLLAGNGRGVVWTASEQGLSRLQNGVFTNYPNPGGETDWGYIYYMVVGIDGVAYAATNNFIVKIAENNVSTITYPEGFDPSDCFLGIDDNGRLWLAGKLFYEYKSYYRNSVDQWQQLPESVSIYATKFMSDGAGGIWIGGFEKLIHINSDLSSKEYSLPENSFSNSYIRDMHLDATGILWILINEAQLGALPQFENAHSGPKQVLYTLQNDIFTLKAIATTEEVTPGYPSGGIWGIAEAGAGNIVFAGTECKVIVDSNDYDFCVDHLYKLNQDGFTVASTAFYFHHEGGSDGYGSSALVSDGNFIYAIGDIEDSNEQNLLQIGGLGDETLWSMEYPVDVNAGASVNIDLLPAKTLEAGNYILESELVSGLDQKLAAKQYGFLVRGTAVAATIVKSGAADPNVRVDIDQEIKFEVLNNTAENKPDLNLKIKKISPTGNETILQDGPLSLNAGQSNNGTLTFNESETGTWQMNIEVREGNTLLDSAELTLRNSEPAVTYEIIYPEYAGDEPFAVKIKLVNTGMIATNVYILVGATGGSPSYLDENVSLNPNEERILSFTDTISVDRTYDVTLSGDLTQNEQKTVKYGYVENLALNVLPQYREGGITMGYTMANSGGLPFSSTIHFELFAMGNAVAIYTADKTYNLYPGAPASADSLELSLAPGAYQLRWTTGKGGTGQADFAVLAAGIGQLVFAPAVKYPIGLSDMAYQITNTDTVAGSIPLLIEILPAAGGTPVFSQIKNYYLNTGESVGDAFSFDFAQSGAYMVRLSGAKIVGGMVSMPFKVLNLNEVTSSVTVQPAAEGVVPVLVNINNTGYTDFSGTLVIEAGGLRHEEPLTVISEATLNQPFNFDANGLTSGSQEVKAYIYDAAGNILAQNMQTVIIKNADIKVSEVPQNLAIAAGSFANATLKVKNEGNRRGEAKISLNAFDTLNETRELVLEAGEEKELTDIFIHVDGDIPAGRYPFNYTLSGLGVTNGLAKGNFNFQVNGIALDVTAALDRSIYSEGETAQLTINISAANPVTTPLEAVVNWNDYSERRVFSLNSGSSSQVFEIPLAQAGSAKVFYGIYQEGGRGIYLNDIYLNFSGNVSVTLDQQVYAPGSSIQALFTVGEPGNLTAECFGQSQTVAIGSSSGISFAVPIDALGGSYGVAWTFTPANMQHTGSSGAKAFDVSGLVVKVAKAELERGKYAPGETIKAMLSLESNRDIALNLRSWTTTPEAQWTYLGEQGVTLSATQQTPVILSNAFNTAEAGTHRLVYGLYLGEQVVVSGSAAFDCGDAVLLGLRTDRQDYPEGTENVRLRIDHFGSGSAALQLFLDDVKIDERSIGLAGLGVTEIVLTAAQINGGSHNLRVVMSKDGLTSVKHTAFSYGSSLPDLTVGLAARNQGGLDYTYTVRAANSGKTAAAANAVVFNVDGSDLQSTAVAQLAPGAYQDVLFTWSGTGHAGSHNLRFTIDRENTLKEFSESNNTAESYEEVPSIFYRLETEPQIWPANGNVSIFTHLIGNMAEAAQLHLQLNLSHNASSQIVFSRAKDLTLNPFTQTIETDVLNTGNYPVGDYTLRQDISGDNISLSAELPVTIEASKIISGTMSIVPDTITALKETEVQLQLSLHNDGNIALADEVLNIEVSEKVNQQLVKGDSITISLALGESKTVNQPLTLNLSEGIYIVALKYGETEVARAELTAVKSLDNNKYISTRPRLLFLNLLGQPHGANKNFIKGVLNAAGIGYADNDNLLDSYMNYQKCEHNINVVFGKLPGPNLQKELRERVSRGEGLIYIVDSAANGGVLEELGGINVGNVPAPQREKSIVVLPGLLGSGGSAVLNNNCKLMLEVLADDARVIAETQNGKKPVLVYREYGRGKVLTVCMPLECSSGGEMIGQVLLNAVNLFNREVFSQSDLARVMPMELRIKNDTGIDKVFRVQELLPETAAGYGYNPPLLAGEGIKWDVNLKVNEEKFIGYWLKLPDTIGTYAIRSEIYDNEQKIDEAGLSFAVMQSLVGRLDEIIGEVGGGGIGQASTILALLSNVRNRNGSDALTLWLNLNDCIRAAELLGQAPESAATALREKTQNVMLVYARRLYEKLLSFKPFELLTFGSHFQE